MKTTSPHPYRVLLADDQADIRDALRLLLKREGYETQGVASPAEALSAIESREFDAALMDLNYTRDTTSGQEGLDLHTRIQMLDSTLPVIVMTAWSSIEVAVGNAPRCTRLCPEAVGKHAPARHSANANRFAPGAEAGLAARSGKSHPARRI